MPQLYPHLRSALGDGANQVHMSDRDCFPSVVSIPKGETVRLYVDTTASHTIANGAWNNGKLRLSQEPGAPEFDNVQVTRESPQTLGPFNSVGTFRFCSTMQRGMNLTVHVNE